MMNGPDLRMRAVVRWSVMWDVGGLMISDHDSDEVNWESVDRRRALVFRLRQFPPRLASCGLGSCPMALWMSSKGSEAGFDHA